jgi:hypothetical protein
MSRLRSAAGTGFSAGCRVSVGNENLDESILLSDIASNALGELQFWLPLFFVFGAKALWNECVRSPTSRGASEDANFAAPLPRCLMRIPHQFASTAGDGASPVSTVDV